ncbi:hypothetical protein ACFL5H_00670 [Candidatus Latescibacterota bacterium]
MVFIGSGDLGRFSGLDSNNPQYTDLVNQIKSDILWAGKWVGGLSRWADQPGYLFFQGRRTTGQ